MALPKIALPIIALLIIALPLYKMVVLIHFFTRLADMTILYLTSDFCTFAVQGSWQTNNYTLLEDLSLPCVLFLNNIYNNIFYCSSLVNFWVSQCQLDGQNPRDSQNMVTEIGLKLNGQSWVAETFSVWIKSLPPTFLPSRKKSALSPFSLITYQVKSTYLNSKYILKKNCSIENNILIIIFGRSLQFFWNIENSFPV